MLGYRHYSKALLLFLCCAAFFLGGCEKLGINLGLRESVKPGSEICRENVVLHSRDVGNMYGAKGVNGVLSLLSLAGQVDYDFDLIDAPSGLSYRFKPHFKEIRVDRGYIIETEHEATYDYCFAADSDVAPGTYDITADVKFFNPADKEQRSSIQIPYQITVESAGE
jgi:hypothetical protein